MAEASYPQLSILVVLTRAITPIRPCLVYGRKEPRSMWSPDTRKRQRPERDVSWQTPLLNGDIQVIYQEDRLDTPNPSYPYPDPRVDDPQRYYLGMWNEGVFEPMAQLLYDFDVRRFLVGFSRLEEEPGNTDP